MRHRAAKRSPRITKDRKPIFTPATKAVSGHDENISFEKMVSIVGHDVAERLQDFSIALYTEAAAYASQRGIIIADTKFEFGRSIRHGGIVLGDEVLTPDSSRFWDAQVYEPGKPQPSFDKQFVRDWALGTGWDRESPAPAIPQDIVRATQQKYLEAYIRLFG